MGGYVDSTKMHASYIAPNQITLLRIQKLTEDCRLIYAANDQVKCIVRIRQNMTRVGAKSEQRVYSKRELGA